MQSVSHCHTHPFLQRFPAELSQCSAFGLGISGPSDTPSCLCSYTKPKIKPTNPTNKTPDFPFHSRNIERGFLPSESQTHLFFSMPLNSERNLVRSLGIIFPFRFVFYLLIHVHCSPHTGFVSRRPKLLFPWNHVDCVKESTSRRSASAAHHKLRSSQRAI